MRFENWNWGCRLLKIKELMNVSWWFHGGIGFDEHVCYTYKSGLVEKDKLEERLKEI